MALIDWSLSHEMSVPDWNELMSVVGTLAQDGLPLLLESQGKASLNASSWWQAWLLKKQRDQFLRMNTPPFRWGLQGQGFTSVQMELLPGPKGVDSLEEASGFAVRATRLPHHGTVEIGPHLHAFAWWGALTWAQRQWPEQWAFQSTLPTNQTADIQRWADISLMKR